MTTEPTELEFQRGICEVELTQFGRQLLAAGVPKEAIVQAFSSVSALFAVEQYGTETGAVAICDLVRRIASVGIAANPGPLR